MLVQLKRYNLPKNRRTKKRHDRIRRLTDNEKMEIRLLENTQATVCLGKSEDKCDPEKCVFEDKKCMPNVLKKEKVCYGKSYNECKSPCKFYGKSVHDKDKCYYKYENTEELKLEQQLIAKEIAGFKRFIKILKNKNKSIVFHLAEEINKTNKQLDKLIDKKKALDKGDLIGTAEYLKVAEDIGKLKTNKISYEAIIKSIKTLDEKEDN